MSACGPKRSTRPTRPKSTSRREADREADRAEWRATYLTESHCVRRLRYLAAAIESRTAAPYMVEAWRLYESAGDRAVTEAEARSAASPDDVLLRAAATLVRLLVPEVPEPRLEIGQCSVIPPDSDEIGPFEDRPRCDRTEPANSAAPPKPRHRLFDAPRSAELEGRSTVEETTARATAFRQTLESAARLRMGVRHFRVAGALLLEHGDDARRALWSAQVDVDTALRRRIDGLLATAGIALDEMERLVLVARHGTGNEVERLAGEALDGLSDADIAAMALRASHGNEKNSETSDHAHFLLDALAQRQRAQRRKTRRRHTEHSARSERDK